ncbi:SDR family oxidoreductase [Planctomycetota bacterium]
MFDFSDQTAIVTGGTRGIGRGITEAFLQAGARVIAIYTSNEAAAASMKTELAEFSARLDLQKTNVADADAVERFYGYIEENYDGFEILVNNAGIRRDNVIPGMPVEDWKAVLDVNLGGTFLMCKYGVKLLMGKRYGRIINITSTMSRSGFRGLGNYTASKAGQIGLTLSLSKEVATRKITVNCVSPGFIETELIADLPPDQVTAYKSQVPMKRFGSVAEVAHAVLFLAGREAAYITGTVLEVSGGL